MRRPLVFGLVGLIFCARPWATLAQSPADLHFEAGSIKAVPEGTRFKCGDDGPLCSNFPPRMINPQRFRAVSAITGPMGILEWAYDVRDFQVAEAPEWLSRQLFEVLATVDQPVREDQLKQMVRSLLADRFHLKLHRETREIPVYALVVAKNGPKFAPAKNDVPGPGDIEIRPGHLAAIGTTMALLSKILTENLERPVVDKTNLDGHYDFALNYDPPSTGTGFQPIGAAIFAPIQDLGLKLESQNAPFEVLVIDRIEKPSEN